MFRVKGQQEKLIDIVTYVKSMANGAGLSDQDVGRVELAVEELFVNVCTHGGVSGETPEVVLDCFLDDKVFVVEFSDNGKEFNILDAEKPDLDLDVEERDVGGLGVYLVLSIIDEVYYEYAKGWNKVTLKLNL